MNNSLETTVKSINGVPTFHINNEPFTIPIFETYRPEEYYFRQFEAAGCKVFSFNANSGRCDYGHSLPIWEYKNNINFGSFDNRLDEVLRVNPNALFMPRVMIGTPDWWLEENPEELMVLDNGKTQIDEYANFLKSYPTNRPFPSIASNKWRNDMAEGLKKLVRHIMDKYANNLFGFFISGLHTEEWYHWCCSTQERSDYSKPMQNAFYNWVKNKYKTIDKLRESWNDNKITFESVTIPTKEQREDHSTFRDPKVAMNVIDFYVFWNEIIPDTIDFFAKVVKDETNKEKVVGAFYAYMYEFHGNSEFGHNALSKYNQSSNLDFVFVTASYDNRKIGIGGDYLRAPANSTMLSGKLWYHDNDVASFLTPNILKPGNGFTQEQAEHYWNVLGVTKNAKESIYMYLRSAGFALCTGLFESYFDLHGGYFDDPQLMGAVSSINRMFDRSKNYDRSSCSQILVLSDEESCAYGGFDSKAMSNALHNTQYELIKIGAQCDHYLTCDIDKMSDEQLSRYKLVIFLNCFSLSQDKRKIIENKLKKDKRVLLFLYAAGLFNQNNQSNEYMQYLTGIRLKCEKINHYIPKVTMNINNFTFQSPKEVEVAVYSIDDEVEVLGIDEMIKKDSFVKKEMDKYTSIFCVSPNIPAKILRQIAKSAGVHIYNDMDDTLYVNKSYLCIHANCDGVRNIYFDKTVTVFDAITETQLYFKVDKINLNMENGETKLLRLE